MTVPNVANLLLSVDIFANTNWKFANETFACSSFVALLASCYLFSFFLNCFYFQVLVPTSDMQRSWTRNSQTINFCWGLQWNQLFSFYTDRCQWVFFCISVAVLFDIFFLSIWVRMLNFRWIRLLVSININNFMKLEQQCIIIKLESWMLVLLELNYIYCIHTYICTYTNPYT